MPQSSPPFPTLVSQMPLQLHKQGTNAMTFPCLSPAFGTQAYPIFEPGQFHSAIVTTSFFWMVLTIEQFPTCQVPFGRFWLPVILIPLQLQRGKGKEMECISPLKLPLVQPGMLSKACGVARGQKTAILPCSLPRQR